jgi:hypothetical protein
MEIGQTYLIETVDWFAWVGRVKKQVGPWEYEFTSVSKIAETNNGDNWHEIAAGDEEARKAATYKHYKETSDGRGVILGMGVVNKIPWEGLTPQEEGLPET